MLLPAAAAADGDLRRHRAVIAPPSALDFGAQAGEQALTICGTRTPATRGTWGRLKTIYR